MVSYSQTGMPIYKAEDQFDPNSVIYSNPSDAQMGLSDEEVQDFRRTYQGGLFNPGHENAAGDFIQGGYQVHDTPLTEGPYRGRYMTPVIGEGVYQPDPEGVHPNPIFDSEPAPPPVGGDGAYTTEDIWEMSTALQDANFGNQERVNPYSLFTDAGGGTFDVDPHSGYAGLFNMDGVPSTDYEFPNNGGKPSHQMRMMRAVANARNIDHSGGGADN